MRKLRYKLKNNGVSIYDTDAFIAFMLRNNPKENYIFFESFGESLAKIEGFAKLITKLENIIDMIIVSHGVDEARKFNYYVINQYFNKNLGCDSYRLIKSLIDKQEYPQTIKSLIKSKKGNVLGLEDEAIKGLMSKAMYDLYLDYVKLMCSGMSSICDYLKKARHAYIHHGGIVKDRDYDSLEKVNVSMMKMLVLFNRVNESKWTRFVNRIRNRWIIWNVKTSLVRDSISSCFSNGVHIISAMVELGWNTCQLFFSLLKMGVTYLATIAIALCLLAVFSKFTQKRKNFEDVAMTELLQGSLMEKDRLYMERVEIAKSLKSDSKLKSIQQRTNVLNEYAKEKNEIPNLLIRLFPVVNQYEWVGEYRKSDLGALFNVDIQGQSKMKDKKGAEVKNPKEAKKSVDNGPKRNLPPEKRYINSGNHFVQYTDNLYFGFESSVISNVDGLMVLASDIKRKIHPSCVLEIKCGMTNSEKSGDKLREERVRYVIRRLQEAGVKNKLVASRENSKNNKIELTMYVPEDL